MSDSQAKHKTIYLKDYCPPDYLVETVNLEFDLDETRTRVKSLLTVVCNHDRCEGIHPLVLNGGGPEITGIASSASMGRIVAGTPNTPPSFTAGSLRYPSFMSVPSSK